MKIMLDTHIYVDWVEQIRLTPNEVQAINQLNRKGSVYISSIIFWEIALMAEKNKLERGIKGFTQSELISWKEESLEKSNIQIIEPSIDDLIKSVYLPQFHKDPFDRLLIAQAKNNDATILTRDKTISDYKIDTITPQQITSYTNRNPQ